MNLPKETVSLPDKPVLLRRTHFFMMGGALMIVALGLFFVRRFTSESEAGLARQTRMSESEPVAVPEHSDAEFEVAEATNEESAEDQNSHPLLFGSWKDNFYGERTMTFLPDGTGTMRIQLDLIGQAIYGKSLLFHLAWEDRDGVLEMKFTSGEPKEAVATISKAFGDTHHQKIELLTESELHLRSTDSNNLYKLIRVDP